MSRGLVHDEHCDEGDWDAMCSSCRAEAIVDDRQARAEDDR